MTRETAEHVAHLAAILAQQPQYHADHGILSPVPAHVAAREACSLAAVAKRAHMFAEKDCNGDIAGSEDDILKMHARFRADAARILARFGLAVGMQWDPRGWPIAVHASAANATDWEYNGSPRELIRVTPHA